jgi:HPt (histidine-containing phosphotransfer) domain-containing protein
VVSDHVGTDPSARSSCVVGVLDADGYLSDNTLGLLAGPESFGDVSVGAVQLEVWMKNRGDRRPRGEDGPWRNRLGRLLVRMQDLEFRTTNSAMQVLRRRAGTVGLGGNGQFTRLSVLDELVEKHDRPWGKKLCEDYELGLNVLELGQRTHYVSEAHVSQEALPYLRRLLTQRTRWAQGNMECASHLGALRRSGHLRPAGLLEIHHFMAQPLLVMLNLFLIPLLTVLTILEHGTAAWTPGSVVILVVTVCCFLLLPYAIWGPVYRWVTGGEVPALTALALGLVNVVYVYLTYIYYVRATWRSLTGRTSWTKTRRNADGRRHAPIEVPTSVTALRLVHPATLDALTEELEGNTEFVSAFAVMWPTRLARLELAIGEENPVAIRDAAGSLRISSSMVGAEQLASVAELVEQRLETDDMEGCRTLLGLVTDVGTRTMTALREELSTVQPAPQQREFRSLDAIIESRRATPA